MVNILKNDRKLVDVVNRDYLVQISYFTIRDTEGQKDKSDFRGS